MKRALGLLAALLTLLTAAPALAQSSATPVVGGQLQTGICPAGLTTCFVPGTPLTPLEVLATTFTSTGTGTLSASTTSSNAALPANGSVLEVTNNGSVSAWVNLGTGTGTTATTSNLLIPAGQAVFIYTGTANRVAAITASSTASLALSSGNLSAISGGGGGGGNVTITSPTGPGADSTGVTVTLATSAITALNNINTNVQAPIPAGSNIIGKVDIDQTTPGTTNGVQDAATGATGSTAPTKAIYAGGISSGNLTGIIQGDTTNAIAISTGTTTQVIALAASKKTYITSLSILPVSAAVNITIEYGTGTNCATVVGYLAGSASIPAATLTTGEGWTESAGLGPEYVVPSGDEICIVTSGSSNVGGHVTFTQF